MGIKFFQVSILFFFSFSAIAQKFQLISEVDRNGYRYETVVNDPTGLRVYTLKNGLKVYLSKNTDAPRVKSIVAVKAGSVYDPSNSTGLAHYLEHLLFKGSDKIGTLDWQKEKPLLDKISELYEDARNEADATKKKHIYRQIDSLSVEASKYGISGEYMKLLAELGAVGINATTNVEHTAYVSLVPAGSLERFLQLEKERFSNIALRTFQNELEVVYEEYNKEMDDVWEIKYYNITKKIFEKHPYGQQQVIGTAAHLKSPSIKDVQEYFNKYYVPNNMAIILVGDIDYDKTIQLVNTSLGQLTPKTLKKPVFEKENPLTSPRKLEVITPHPESVYIGYRFNGAKSPEEKYIMLMNLLLDNGTAGLFDTELKGKGLVENAESSTEINNDYGVHYIDGYPKSGQTLDEVKALMLEQIEKIKKGDIEGWRIKSIVNEWKNKQVEKMNNINGVGSEYLSSVIRDEDWRDRLKLFSAIEQITKDELVKFARSFYKDNYTVLYKRKGNGVVEEKIEKLTITPIKVNEGKSSFFANEINKIPLVNNKPEFSDYKKMIRSKNISQGVDLSYVTNTKNDKFEMDFIFEVGKNNDKKWALALDLLNHIGTKQYDSKQLKLEFYKAGVSFRINAGNNQTSIHIEGLNSQINKAIELTVNFLDKAYATQADYDTYVDRVVAARNSIKSNKSAILFQGLVSFALYGEQSSKRNIFSEKELRNFKIEELIDLIRTIRSYAHRIFYYGKDEQKVLHKLKAAYEHIRPVKNFPTETKYVKLPTKRRVYFVDMEINQPDVLMLTRGELLAPSSMGLINMFSRYIEKIFYQEVRNKRALSYTAYAGGNIAADSEDYNYADIRMVTQYDKLEEGLQLMSNMMHKMPESLDFFQTAKQDQLKRYESDRVRGSNIFWNFENYKMQGIHYDVREEMYNDTKLVDLNKLREFYNQQFGNREVALLVVGDKKKDGHEIIGKIW